MGLSKLSPPGCPNSPAVRAWPNWLLEKVFVVIFMSLRLSHAPLLHIFMKVWQSIFVRGWS